MSNVQAVRIVKREAFMQGMQIALDEQVKTLCIKFADGKGGVVSLAFDGRCNRAVESGREVRETYFVYADCPVKFNDTDVIDRSVVRALRDALNALDLTGE